MENELYFKDRVISNFTEELTTYANQPSLRFLQVGAHVGHSSKWLLDHILTNPTSVLVDVDAWDNTLWPGDDREKEYDTRLLSYSNVKKVKLLSNDFFNTNHELFDFIYVDGSYKNSQTYFDGVMGFECLKVNGVMVFDDYKINNDFGARYASTTRFIKEYKEFITYKVLRDQMWVVKV
jgi:predicted O-methyltransferase YrrM